MLPLVPTLQPEAIVEAKASQVRSAPSVRPGQRITRDSRSQPQSTAKYPVASTAELPRECRLDRGKGREQLGDADRARLGELMDVRPVNVGGRERTLREFTELLNAADLTLRSREDTQLAVSVLTASR